MDLILLYSHISRKKYLLCTADTWFKWLSYAWFADEECLCHQQVEKSSWIFEEAFLSTHLKIVQRGMLWFHLIDLYHIVDLHSLSNLQDIFMSTIQGDMIMNLHLTMYLLITGLVIICKLIHENVNIAWEDNYPIEHEKNKFMNKVRKQ